MFAVDYTLDLDGQHVVSTSRLHQWVLHFRFEHELRMEQGIVVAVPVVRIGRNVVVEVFVVWVAVGVVAEVVELVQSEDIPMSN